MNTSNSLKGLLVLIALLLGANLLVQLFGSRSDQSLPFPASPVHAGQFVDQNRPYLLTTNESGNVLYVWHLGSFVNDRIDGVDVQVFPASVHNK